MAQAAAEAEGFANATSDVFEVSGMRPTRGIGVELGMSVTLSGRVTAIGEVVAETHVSSDRLLAVRRCRGHVHLDLEGGARVLLDGPLAVAVGTHERKRYVAPHGMVSFRQLRVGSVARARGRWTTPARIWRATATAMRSVTRCGRWTS